MTARRRSRAPLLYLWSQTRVATTLQALKGIFDGVWLGALSEHQLDDLDASFYNSQRIYAGEGHNTSGLRPWERSFVDRHLDDGDRVVVIGAGGGREVLALLESGHDAIGFECSAELADRGAGLLAQRGWPGRLHHAPRHSWPPAAGRCDAVIVGWGAYMLIRGRDRRVAFLRDVRGALPADAPVLLSFFARNHTTAYLRAVAAAGNVLRRVLRRPPIDLGDALAPNYVHHFTRDEIVSELTAAGFGLVSYDTTDYGVAIARATPRPTQKGTTCPQVPATTT